MELYDSRNESAKVQLANKECMYVNTTHVMCGIVEIKSS